PPSGDRPVGVRRRARAGRGAPGAFDPERRPVRRRDAAEGRSPGASARVERRRGLAAHPRAERAAAARAARGDRARTRHGAAPPRQPGGDPAALRGVRAHPRRETPRADRDRARPLPAAREPARAGHGRVPVGARRPRRRRQRPRGLELVDESKLGDGVGGDLLRATLGYWETRRGRNRERALELARAAIAPQRMDMLGTRGLHLTTYTLTMCGFPDEALAVYDRVLRAAYARGDNVLASSVALF